MEILYALEKLRTPFFDAFLGALTELGNETVFMAAALILYWCVSKKWGYYMLWVGTFGTLVNQFAKIICRVPRPWVRDSGFTIVENARAQDLTAFLAKLDDIGAGYQLGDFGIRFFYSCLRSQSAGSSVRCMAILRT